MRNCILPFAVALILICGMCSCGRRSDETRSSLPLERASQKESTAKREKNELVLTGPQDLVRLLSPGKVSVTIMGYAVSPRTEELMARWKEALKKYPQWFLEYMKKQSSGMALPYHPNFGLSEDEYADMLKGMNEMKVIPIGNSSLMILHKSDDLIGFEGSGRLSPLNSVEINTKTGEIATPFGNPLKNPQVSNNNKGPLGPYVSLLWQISEGNVEEGTYVSASIGIGKIAGSDQAFIDYRAKAAESGEQLRRADVLIKLDVPSGKQSVGRVQR